VFCIGLYTLSNLHLIIIIHIEFSCTYHIAFAVVFYICSVFLLVCIFQSFTKLYSNIFFPKSGGPALPA